MKVLVVKMTSLGDVIHTLPALTDASAAFPDIEFDWLVEAPFQMIPKWHKHVKRVIPLKLRHWRKNAWQAFRAGEFKDLFKEVRQYKYDAVIDAQGLLKSALLTLACRGRTMGFNWASARESLASLFYQNHAEASWSLHAVTRTRLLFAQSLGYSFEEKKLDYGIDKAHFMKSPPSSSDPYCIFLHGTTWTTKHWPVSFWIELGQQLANAGYKIKLLWGNDAEKERAIQIAKSIPSACAEVMPKLGLSEIASLLVHAKGVVSVDTGLGHLAAALSVPTVSLYGPTDPIRTGCMGQQQLHLKAEFPCSPCLKKTCTYQEDFPPCFNSLSPERVWKQFQQHMITSSTL